MKIATKSVSKNKTTTPAFHGIVRFDAFDHFYTSPRDALWKLRERRKDSELKKAVRGNLGSVAEGILKKFTQPRAVLFRQIGTPTHETLRFLRMAKQMGLKPLILEYHGDKFVSAGNRYKRSLGKMPIYQHTGSDGRDMVQYHTVCDFNTATGKNFNKINCISGESFIDFHHSLLRSLSKMNPKTCCVDATDWFNSSGARAGNYYENFLSLFIRDSILFENYLTTRTEAPFVESSVLPAVQRLQEIYGMKPLIVRLLPSEEELRLFWDSYPKKIINFIQ